MSLRYVVRSRSASLMRSTSAWTRATNDRIDTSCSGRQSAFLQRRRWDHSAHRLPTSCLSNTWSAAFVSPMRSTRRWTRVTMVWCINPMFTENPRSSTSPLSARSTRVWTRATNVWIFYITSLQSLTRSHFRAVDEIKQGMDPETNVWNI